MTPLLWRCIKALMQGVSACVPSHSRRPSPAWPSPIGELFVTHFKSRLHLDRFDLFCSPLFFRLFFQGILCPCAGQGAGGRRPQRVPTVPASLPLNTETTLCPPDLTFLLLMYV